MTDVTGTLLHIGHHILEVRFQVGLSFRLLLSKGDSDGLNGRNWGKLTRPQMASEEAIVCRLDY